MEGVGVVKVTEFDMLRKKMTNALRQAEEEYVRLGKGKGVDRGPETASSVSFGIGALGTLGIEVEEMLMSFCLVAA